MFVDMWLESVDPVEQPEPSEIGTASWEVLSPPEEEAWAAAVADLEPGDPLRWLRVAAGGSFDSVDLDALTGKGWSLL